MGARSKKVIVCQPGRTKDPFRLSIVLLPVGKATSFWLFFWSCGWSVQSGDKDISWISCLIFLAEVLDNKLAVNFLSVC